MSPTQSRCRTATRSGRRRTASSTPHQADTPQMVAPLLAERVRVNVQAFLGDGRFVGLVDPGAGY